MNRKLTIEENNMLSKLNIYTRWYGEEISEEQLVALAKRMVAEKINIKELGRKIRLDN